MVLRDINIFSDLIQERLDLVLSLDSSVLNKFESMTKHKNYIFSSGVDFIHEFFKFDNNLNCLISKYIFNILSNNKLFKHYISNYANKGINF